MVSLTFLCLFSLLYLTLSVGEKPSSSAFVSWQVRIKMRLSAFRMSLSNCVVAKNLKFVLYHRV